MTTTTHRSGASSLARTSSSSSSASASSASSEAGTSSVASRDSAYVLLPVDQAAAALRAAVATPPVPVPECATMETAVATAAAMGPMRGGGMTRATEGTLSTTMAVTASKTL